MPFVLEPTVHSLTQRKHPHASHALPYTVLYYISITCFEAQTQENAPMRKIFVRPVQAKCIASVLFCSVHDENAFSFRRACACAHAETAGTQPIQRLSVLRSWSNRLCAVYNSVPGLMFAEKLVFCGVAATRKNFTSPRRTLPTHSAVQAQHVVHTIDGRCCKWRIYGMWTWALP